MSVKKIRNMFELMKMLFEGREIYIQDKMLQKELEINERTLRRYIDDIVVNFSDSIFVDKKTCLNNRKTNIYKIGNKKNDVSVILQFFLENTVDLSWVLKLINEQDPSLINESKESIRNKVESILDQQKDIFLFRSPPFELVEGIEQKKIFASAKRAVKNSEYATITYFYDKKEILHNVKCLKMIYVHYNWYLAVEDEKKQFRFLRLVFIKTITYADKTTFQPSKVKKYQRFFNEFQNAFSLPDKAQHTAHLRASKKIAKYFKKDMKPFFLSQKIINLNDDGSIEFSIKYTQTLEILPFIKKWLPDIEILEPKSLQLEFKKDLEKALKIM